MNEKIMWIIINPASGTSDRKDKVTKAVRHYAKHYSLKTEIMISTGKKETEKIINRALKEKIQIIAVAGGDGTINSVASLLVNSTVHFGVIPTGSGNGFAGNFGIPLDIEQAVKLLFTYNRVLTIDCGKLNDHYFFNTAGTGLDADIAFKFETIKGRGTLSYYIAGLKTLLNFKPHSLSYSSGKRTEKIKPYLLMFANGKQYGANKIIAPDALYNDGLLDVIVYKKSGILTLLKNTAKFIIQSPNLMKKFNVEKVDSATLEFAGKIPFHIDGEPIYIDNHAKINIVPKALNVISSFE